MRRDSNARLHIERGKGKGKSKPCVFNFTVKWDEHGYYIHLLSESRRYCNNGCAIVVLSKIDMYVHILFCVLFCVLIPHQQSHKHETGWEIRSVTLRSCTSVNQQIPTNDTFSYFITIIHCGMSFMHNCRNRRECIAQCSELSLLR